VINRPQISLLVPFRPSVEHPHRVRLWAWLEQYWRYELPDAEIVIGRSTSETFSKTEAVNDAARRATGRIFVILDSDTYIRGTAILKCARAIEDAQRRGHRLWFIPYRRLYRLTEESTEQVLASSHQWPFRFPSPPPVDEVESTVGSMHGHHFGAMIQVMPREAFELVGGMDPRFQGWGGEDVSFMRAVDTLYAKHKTLRHDVLHLWHPSIGITVYDRMWEGQQRPGSNSRLAERYNRAVGDRVRMLALVDEGHRFTQDCHHPHRHHPYHDHWLRRVIFAVLRFLGLV
jgi:hypothetical protein